jgi:CDP-glycerol glycerophosphotransferase (TagB/SpsB family)
MGQQQLPDELWVVDEDAEILAKSTFLHTPVKRQENMYVAEQLQKITPSPSEGGRILYVLEPVRNDWGRNVGGEFQALDYAIEHLPKIVNMNNVMLSLRPHPSESTEKYEAYTHQYSFIQMDDSVDLAAAISRSNVVIGVESFALTIALLANRPTYSSLPPWAPAIRLPQKGIVQIRRMVNVL